MKQTDDGCLSVYPTLCVPDVSATIEFYVQKLGFRLQFEWGEPPVHAGLQFGEATIHCCQGTPNPDGFWLYFHVEDVDDLFVRCQDHEVTILDEPTTQVWGMREFNIEDLNGYHLRFGQSDLKYGEPVLVERVDMQLRIEKRLSQLLTDLAEHKQLTMSEMLEETLLHSFEAMPHLEGQGVASPHTKRTMRFIQELKEKHGIDYDTHDSYRFTEARNGT